jgi:hypothetical protein
MCMYILQFTSNLEWILLYVMSIYICLYIYIHIHTYTCIYIFNHHHHHHHHYLKYAPSEAKFIPTLNHSRLEVSRHFFLLILIWIESLYIYIYISIYLSIYTYK